MSDEAEEYDIIYRNAYLFVKKYRIGSLAYGYLICTNLLESPDDIITAVDTLEECVPVVNALMTWDTKHIIEWGE